MSVVPTEGSSSITIDSVSSGGIDIYPSNSFSAPLDVTVNILGTMTVHRPTYPAVAWYTNRSNANLSVIVGSGVTLVSDQNMGGIWLRNEVSGNLAINSAATVTATGALQDGITLTTNLGSSTLINSGTVTSALARGLYADGNFNGTDPVTVSIVNSGQVTSELAGARSINYNGLSSIVNSGIVESRVRQGLVAWSANGSSSITNSGTVTAQDDSAIVSMAETGNVTIINSGTAISRDNTGQVDQGTGHHGLYAEIGTAGTITIENQPGGVVQANQTGILAVSASGAVNITQAGSVTAARGIAASTGSGAVSVTNSGTVTATGVGVELNGTTNALINSGAITTSSASDAAIVTGNGDTTITNAGTISNTGGGTAISFGSGTNRLVLDADRSIIQGIVQAGTGNNSLVLQTSNAASLTMLSVGSSGQYRDFDSIEKTGAGTLTLSGNGSGFTGTMLVKEGGLVVDSNSQTSAVTVYSGAVVSGSGTLGATDLLSGAAISPGNSPGTLNVAGNYHQASGATYNAELVPGSAVSDLIAVNGVATIDSGAILNLSRYGAGAYAPDAHYTVLTATGGITGTYILTGDTFVSSFYSLIANYDLNHVYLDAVQTRSFVAAATTVNQRATATALQALPTGSALRYGISSSATDVAARAAFDQVSGEVYASAKTALLDDSRFVREATARQVQSSARGAGASVWTRSYGSWANFDGNGNAGDFSRTTGGVLYGADGEVFDAFRLGVVGGYGYSSISLDSGRGSVSGDTYSVGAYGGGNWGAIAMSVGVNHAWHDLSSRRNLAFAGFADRLSADYNARTTQVYGDVGYNIELGRAALQPFLGLAHVSLDTSGFTEKGGAAALTSAGDTIDATFGTLGLRAKTTVELGWTAVTANGMVGWRHSLNHVTPTVTNALAGGSAFTVAGVPLVQDVAVFEAGLGTALSPSMAVSLNYSGQVGSGILDQGVRANFNATF
ncbi:autotransporter domain-containing protein [Rhodopseudomonas palustris]|uniref:autotransporter outer membrane beta-barrel domain-containing protein n=1 Tax=Rhodopseudomonas palustris TaxID=1076 RepID=UPI002ACDA780|nr:autotransporter domain-containing protein [Rhodopseudomonas palustris]WQH00377.1 autotransporter domain-containing protein [Rhodopseudomonas palustris]